MKRGLFFLLGLCVTGIVVAQPSAPSGFDANANLSTLGNGGGMFRSFDNRYTGVKGTSTIFEDFVYGNVNMKDGEKALGQELNYDAMTRELIVRSRIYKRILAVRYDLVESFELITSVGDTLLFKKVMPRGFSQKIYEGEKINMYLNYGKVIIKASYGGAYNANAKNYDEFADQNLYIMKVDGGALEEIKPSRKAFEKRFPEKKAVIQAYFKEHKPDLDKYNEMEGFIAYLDKN